jgi:hypothetical protein
VIILDHEQLPLGTVTVSPDAAALIAVCTSVCEQELAATFCALIAVLRPKTTTASSDIMSAALRFLIIQTILLSAIELAVR